MKLEDCGRRGFGGCFERRGAGGSTNDRRGQILRENPGIALTGKRAQVITKTPFLWTPAT